MYIHTVYTLSVITFAKLMKGAKKSQHVEKNVGRLNALNELLEILPFNKQAAITYGDIRSSLEKQGRVIGSNDLLIAAHALSLDCILVTNNQREFNRVDGLKLENWVA